MTFSPEFVLFIYFPLLKIFANNFLEDTNFKLARPVCFLLYFTLSLDFLFIFFKKTVGF